MATNGHSGYPMKWFEDQNSARNMFECGICLEVLRDPVQICDCGHQFCALCISDILKTDPRCPSCRIKISREVIFDDHAANRLIKQLKVNCCYEGCNWQGCLSLFLEDHSETCSFMKKSGFAFEDFVDQSSFENLFQKVVTLEEKIVTIEQQNEKRLKEIKLKHENDLKKMKIEHANDLKQVTQQVTAKFKERIQFMEATLRTLQLKSDARLSPPLHQFQNHVESEADYILKIDGFNAKLAAAKRQQTYGSVESEPFYSRYRYKMKLFVHLNEAPRGFAGYMGVYINLMKGDLDGCLDWPFTKRVSFVLVDQQDNCWERRNETCLLIPAGNKQFRRPQQLENEGFGFTRFVKHSLLHTREYVRDSTVFIKVFVDT
ncbi:TNF receptor-associated factor 2-like [Xenia sp. Carnegie-2017]|uniref:TNF receptor-associated factor 2-like n=1 Tax=Xenia sp. Carnegie-2017 TaxID=2897299 RepID=UPI001F04ACA4|nr:TNF receptor-associated factor 2-like [Xenia sp. Carnegie-2017]